MQHPLPLKLRAEYRAPDHRIDWVELLFELDRRRTRVVAQLHFRRRAGAPATAPLMLDGEDHLSSHFALDEVPLAVTLPTERGAPLALHGLPEAGVLTVETVIDPEANSALSGLYLTGGTFCTQCEAEGFRRITWFPDRPDVLARYTVTIRAEQASCPVLLSNGNLVATRVLPDGRHEAVWEDPFPKPCYLFALVAGRLDRLSDTFRTRSGRQVSLELYSDAGRVDRFQWAMACLKAAMRWDEEAYGREYDLDRFMIFAAADFNAGAMENKGLNIFNSRYLLADAEIATDQDFQAVDAVVAHEYLHNWSGNRVTCRDWFQLSLKEGFTVLREQQYMAARGSPAVARIDEAAFIVANQFPQAEGPLAHPVRPESYEDIDNFYTVTVYEKGAEVLRMLHRLIGEVAWRRGSDLYFERHDGQAATCDDFLAAMAEASGRDLTQFTRWYSQAGTPRITVTRAFDAARGILTLTFRQSVPATAANTGTEPMVIPIALALLLPDGKLVHEQQIVLTRETESFAFEGLFAPPVPSLLRGFSAPVVVEVSASVADLEHLARYEVDGYARWRAVRELATQAFLEMLSLSAASGQATHAALDALIRVFLSVVEDTAADPALLARLLRLPSPAELADTLEHADPGRVADAHDRLAGVLATALRSAVASRYHALRGGLSGRPYVIDRESSARRALAHALLMLLNTLPDEQAIALAETLFHDADNLTDRMAALSALIRHDTPARSQAMSAFLSRATEGAGEPLLLNRWYELWAKAPDTTAERVTALEARPDFDRRNPNRVRALLQVFASQNWRGFHALDGSGYDLLAERIAAFDRTNPSLAARLTEAFSRWVRMAAPAADRQRQALERLASASLSGQVAECVRKLLSANG
ncbi:MAG: aminopeptidase N [Casimicrobiaceae bacterium]